MYSQNFFLMLYRLSCNSSGCIRKVPRNSQLSASSLFVILFLHPHYTYFFGLRHKCRRILSNAFQSFSTYARTHPAVVERTTIVDVKVEHARESVRSVVRDAATTSPGVTACNKIHIVNIPSASFSYSLSITWTSITCTG